MTRRRGIARYPSLYSVDPARWLDGPLAESAPPAARYARELALRLRRQRGALSLRMLGQITGLSHTTLSGFLRGTTWPDLVTIVHLEWTLGLLWPGADLLAARDAETYAAPGSGAATAPKDPVHPR